MVSNNPNQPIVGYPRTAGDVAAEFHGELADPQIRSIGYAAVHDQMDVAPLSADLKPSLTYPHTSADELNDKHLDEAWDKYTERQKLEGQWELPTVPHPHENK